MTEPTPEPDEPGEGLRTRQAPGSGAVDTVTLETSTPTNGIHNGHTTRNGHEPRNGQPLNNGHPGNGHDRNPHAGDGHADTGHTSNGHAPDGHAEDTRARNGHRGGSAGNEYPANGRGGARPGNASGAERADGARSSTESGGEPGGGGRSRPGGDEAGAATVGAEDLGGEQAGNDHADSGPARNGHAGNGHGRLSAFRSGEGAGPPSRDVVGMTGGGGGPVTFGFGETAGVLPGDQRTFDDVEAGIVALWRQFGEQREQPLRDRLVLHYAPLVKYVAGRVGTGLPAHVEVADLIQSGIFGLVDAIEKFEPERGLKFETYAMQRIRGAILDDLRAQDWVPRSVRGRAREVERALERLGAKLRRTPTDSELADELGLSLHELRDVYAQLQLTSVVALDELAAAGRGPTPLADILEDQEALDPVALLVDQDNRRQLAQAIAHLAERDRVVVTLYYFENLTLAEIGRVLGVTESRVCQLHTRAVLRLRAKLLEKSES